MSNFPTPEEKKVDIRKVQLGACCANVSCTIRETVERKLFRCAGCKAIFYCSRACQKAHWKLHKKDCCFSQERLKMHTNEMDEELEEQFTEFNALFQPEVSKVAQLLLQDDEGTTWLGESHAVNLNLIDLPTKFRPPRMEVRAIKIQPITSLDDDQQRLTARYIVDHPDARVCVMVLNYNGIDGTYFGYVPNAQFSMMPGFRMRPERARDYLNQVIRKATILPGTGAWDDNHKNCTSQLVEEHLRENPDPQMQAYLNLQRNNRS